MQRGKLAVEVVEEGKPTHARVHLTDSRGEIAYAPGGLTYEKDWHFTVEGGFEVELPVGRTLLRIEKGKEYLPISDAVEVPKGGLISREYVLNRWVDMNSLGWYSGDTHVHRMPEKILHLMEAEDLNLVPVLSTWNQRDIFESRAGKRVIREGSRAYSLVNQEDERGAGAVMALNIHRPVRVETGKWYPSQAYFAERWRKQGATVEQEKPFWLEAPVNVALGLVDTIGIVNNHLQRTEAMADEAWGKARNADAYPGDMGFVRNVLDLYYRYLNLGIKLPITAGSASGVLRNPLGYNRLYVKLDNFSYEGWFDGMRSGRAFATNGPMLFFEVDGEVPDLTRRFDGPTSVNLSLKVLCPRKIGSIEILKNGKVSHEYTDEEGIETAIELDLEIGKSAWVIARAFEECEENVRFAHTNPVFIETPDPIIPSATDGKYYQRWCEELLAESRATRDRYETDERRRSVEEKYERAVEFYRDLTCLGSVGKPFIE